MPRLLMVSTVSDALRGFFLPYANYFRAKGWIVDGAARGIADDEDCRRAFSKVWEVGWSRRPAELPNLFRAPRELRRIVHEGEYDIVHVHTPVAAFITRYAISRMRGPRPAVIYTAHGFHFHTGGSPLKNQIFVALERLAGRWTDLLIVINQEDFQAARRYSIVHPSKVAYVPGVGVDTWRYSTTAVEASAVLGVRKALGLSTADRILLMIAEFNPGKRHADLLRAFARLSRPEAHIVFAGVGPLEQRMKDLAATLGIASRAHFLGFRKDIPALIRASFATVLPSEREGLPKSVLESMSLATPVIGTDIRGVRDLLCEGAGVLVRPGDIGGLASAMDGLLADPEKAVRIGRTGRQRVSKYELRRVIEIHEELYAGVLHAPLARSRQASV